MSRFTGPLAVTFLAAGTSEATLDQPLVWEIGAEGSGAVVAVPTGFVTDGISAPRALWVFLPPWGKASRAAILHDWALACLAAGRPLQGLETRPRIDAEFRRALRACGVSAGLATILWAAVRLYGRWRAALS